jgi:RHS repeat-associated protein
LLGFSILKVYIQVQARHSLSILSSLGISSFIWAFGMYLFGSAVELCAVEATSFSQVIYKFTGKERDSESNLDNFGARYDSSTLGRFMSPDPMMASARVWVPQTWNRYAYALNNPLRFVDPDGMKEVSAEDCKKDKNCVTVNVNVIYD